MTTPPDDFDSTRTPSAGASGGYEVVWAPDPAVSDPSGDLPERFELVRDLADGVAGPVFGVRDRDSDSRLVRLEIVPSRLTGVDELRALLNEEVRNARKLVSAHIVRTRDIGNLDDGRFFVVSEIVEGETLRARLHREGELHPREALEIARQVLLGLGGAHAEHIVHGALDTSCIWLAGNAPKSDENPHGIAARIADFGLASFVARANGSVIGDAVIDVRAVGGLLREMNPGAEVAPFAELCTRGEASALDAAAAIVRALRRPTARATSFGSRPVLAAFGTVALVLAVLLWRSRNAVQAQERGVADAELRLAELSTRLGASTQRNEALDLDVLSAKQLLAAERTAAEARIEADATRAKEQAAAALAAQTKEQQARAVADEARAQSARAEARALEAERRARALENESHPAARAARGFDGVLEAVEAGRGAEAERRVVALERDAIAGTALATSLSAAAAALESFASTRATARPSVIDARRAEAAVELARRASDTFAQEASTWIEHTLDDEPAPRRVARATAALATLQRGVAEARARCTAADEDEWAALRAGSGLQDPAAAFAHVDHFGCAHADELAARFASELRAWVIFDGALDVARLQSFAQLGAWCARVDSGAVQLPSAARRELQLLEFAQRWYGSEPIESVAFDWSGIEREPVIGARKDWRNELYVQWSLAQPGSGYPIRAGESRVFRAVDARGDVEWWREGAASIAARRWTVSRVRLSSDARTEVGTGAVEIERRGTVFAVPGATQALLDLGAHGTALLAAAPPPSYRGALPSALGVDARRLAAFRSERDAEPCVVYVCGDVRRWVSARFGLMREESLTERGWFARELVFATETR